MFTSKLCLQYRQVCDETDGNSLGEIEDVKKISNCQLATTDCGWLATAVERPSPGPYDSKMSFCFKFFSA